MNNGDVVLETRGLTKRFGDFTALEGLTLQLERGQILGLIGPNGAGKSTAIRILVGQSRPSSGTALIHGIDCSEDAGELKRLVGYMPDLFGSYDNMRVHEYLDFFAAAFGVRRKERVPRVSDVMEIAGVTRLKDRFVASLSHGMKQRVAIARTILHDPQLIILDEPANGLDPHARIEMRQLLRALAEQGKTLLVSSHILPELSKICDQVAILSRGRLRAFGTLSNVTKELRQRHLFEIELLAVNDLGRAEELIHDKVPACDELETSQEESVVRFSTTQTDFNLSELIESLVHAGVRVTQCREVPMDLEEAFLSIASGDQDA